jgi:hypothetical protein
VQQQKSELHRLQSDLEERTTTVQSLEQTIQTKKSIVMSMPLGGVCIFQTVLPVCSNVKSDLQPEQTNPRPRRPHPTEGHTD